MIIQGVVSVRALRKILSVLLMVVLVPVLWGQLAAHTARALVLEPGSARRIVAGSGVHEELVSQLQAQFTAGFRGEQSPLTPEEIESVFRQALPPAELEALTGQVVDGIQAWFIVGGGRPDMIVDLTAIRSTLPEALRSLIAAKVNELPVCTPFEVARELARESRTMPACRAADPDVNRAIINVALPDAELERLLPAQFDVAAQFEASNPGYWDEMTAEIRPARLSLNLVPWGWVAVLVLLALLVALNLDRWYTPFAWGGAALLIGGGLMLIASLGALTVLVPLFSEAIPGSVYGPAFAQSLVGNVAVALRNLSMLVSLAGLAGIIVAVYGAMSHRPQTLTPTAPTM